MANASARSPFDGWENAASRGLIVVVAASLAWYTWAKWGNFQIDCGRELYVPMEILRGKLIYRDFFYSYGPLAPYVGALLIGIFGPHLVVLYLFGIAVAIGCAILLFEIGTKLEGRAVGLAAALALLSLGFAPEIFNYAFPQSYAATMGLALSLLCALFIIRHLLDRGRYELLIAGLAASLAFLCKQEFGAACYLTLAFVLVIEAALERSMLPLFRGIAGCAPGVVLWVAIYGWFLWTLTPAYMAEANWIGLPWTTGAPYAAHLYAQVGQFVIPLEILILIICAAVGLLLWFLLAKASPILLNAILGILIAIAVANRFGAMGLVARTVITALLVFPVGMFFIGCGFVAYAIYRLNVKRDRRYLAEAAFGIFALIPALRVFALVVPHGYCVYYAMPLFLVFVAVLSRSIKAATPALSADHQRRLVNYLLAAEVVMLALIWIPYGNKRTSRLETSWGEIYMTPTDASVARQILDFITEQKRHGRQVAVLPEAPILYALTGTEAPNRWYTLLPGYLSPTGEDAYTADLSRGAPDYILLTDRSSAEYGVNYFGIDYDQTIYHWIESNYRVAGEFGRFRRDESLSPTEAHLAPLTALLYQRRDSAERKSTAIR